MQKIEVYEKASQILLGLECLYPDKTIIPRIRFALESLTDSQSEKKPIDDLVAILKAMKDYPVTGEIEALLEAGSAKQSLIAVTRLLAHLSYDPTFESFKLMLSHFEEIEAESQKVHNLITRWLKDKSKDPGFEYCQSISEIILEKDSFTKIKKILDFYIHIYDDPELRALKKAYEHFVTLESEMEFFRFLGMTTQSKAISTIQKMKQKGVEANLENAFSKGQMKSKLWAVQKLKELLGPDLDNILILCGWYSIFTVVMFEHYKQDYSRIRSVDLDPACEPLADEFNHHLLVEDWKFKAITRDIMEIDYKYPLEGKFAAALPMENKKGKRWVEPTVYDLVVNTSCEHLADFKLWYDKIPEGQLVLLQTNDYFDHGEHVNCVKTLAEFKEMAPMTETIYGGMLPLTKYNRFMLIGRK